MSTLQKQTTKIQLKTKTSPTTGDGAKTLSQIALDVGEPLVNTNDNTLVIGTSNNKNADDKSAIVLGAGKLVVNSTSESTEDATTALSNGNVHINHIENNKALSSHKIFGARSVKVTADTNADITVSADFELSSPAGKTKDINKVPVQLTDIENPTSPPDEVNIAGIDAVKVYSTTANEILVSADFTLSSDESISAGTNKVAVTLTDANRANHSDTFEIKGGRAVKATSDASGNITLSADFQLYTDTSAVATNGVNVYLKDMENYELAGSDTDKQSQAVDKFNIKGSGATKVTSNAAGNIDINTEYELTATQQPGEKANASDIKLSGDSTDNVVTIKGGYNTGISTSGNVITISDTAALPDTPSDNQYVSAVEQDNGQITVHRRTILENPTAETTKNKTNGDVEVITSLVKPETTEGKNRGIIPKKRKIKGGKDIEVVVPNDDTGITVQHSNSITAKRSTNQTANGAKLTNGGTFTISDVNYNAQGHVNGENTATLTLPEYKNGIGINVEADGTTNDINDYKVNLQTANTSVLGGIKIGKDTTEYSVAGLTSSVSADVSADDHYRAVEIDKNDKAFVFINTADKTNYGIVKLADSASCTTYVSDSLEAVTPSAVRKAVPMFESVTGIRAGASGTTYNNNAVMDDPYIKIIDTQKDFSSGTTPSTPTPKYREQIQLKGGDSTSVKALNGVITIANTATVNDSAVENNYVSQVTQTNGEISVSRSILLADTIDETTKDKANGEVEVITSLTTPNASNGIIPNKRTIKGAKGIEVVVGTNTSDIIVQHTPTDVTQTTTYSDISTDDNASVNIVTPKYDAQGHVTGSVNQKLTVGAATSTKLGTVKYGTTEGTACQGNDSRLTNARQPLSHSHGDITNTGKLGVARSVVVTSDDKTVTTSGITTTELGYLGGVTSNIQTQLNGKAASSHGIHVSYGTAAPSANGTPSAGSAATVSRSDHVHPAQTSVIGNAGTATKLATARTISLTGDVTGSTTFDGSGNVSITTTVADYSHSHSDYAPLSNPIFTGTVTAESFNAKSDARLKENFEPLTVEKSILDLPTYKFDFINGAKNQIGCKAQDLQEICPEIVDENSAGYLSIQESKIVYLLLEEVKKLKAEIEILKGRG